jgi:hypothetical protein
LGTVGACPAGPVAFTCISTDDVNGMIRTYGGEGQFIDDALDPLAAAPWTDKSSAAQICFDSRNIYSPIEIVYIITPCAYVVNAQPLGGKGGFINKPSLFPTG